MSLTRREARALAQRRAEEAAPVRVLVVCTANLIRSPFVAGLLARRLGEGVIVHSAGTKAVAGRPALEETVLRASRHGVDLGGHRSSPLTDAHLREATTVLCAAREHRSAVLRLAPRLARHTFTVAELARLVDARAAERAEGSGARWRAMARSADRRRETTAPVGDADDLIDPIGEPAEVWNVFERAATAAVGRIAQALGERVG